MITDFEQTGTDATTVRDTYWGRRGRGAHPDGQIIDRYGLRLIGHL